MEPELQSLKVATGWTVDWHTFYDVEPSIENMTYLSGDSLFLAKHGNAGYFVCLEWRPEEDINGEFYLVVMPYDKNKEDDDTDKYEWDTILFKANTRDKPLVVKMLNTLMVDGLDKLKTM